MYRREQYLKKIRGFYHSDDLIKVITGIRRCGKSSLMKVIAEELLESGITGGIYHKVQYTCRLTPE